MKSPRHLLLSGTVLSVATLAAQYLVRVLMTGQFGAGREYDGFLLAMIPATLVAQVAYQALASALVPAVNALAEEGHPASAQRLSRRASNWMHGVVVALGVAGTIVLMTSSRDAALVVTVFAGWGLLGGWLVLERQFLLYHGRSLWAAWLTLAPALAICAYGFATPEATLIGYAWTGVAAHGLAAAMAAALNKVSWKALLTKYTPATESNSADLSLRPIFLQSAAVILAGFNAQAMAIIDQTMAAWYTAGGLVLLSAAQSIARLPHTLGENAMRMISYRKIVVSAGRPDTPEKTRETSETFAEAVRLQLFFAAPACLLMFFFAGDVVAILFGRGEFGPEDVGQAADILRWFPACALALVLQSVQVQFLVAMKRAGTALRIEVVLTAFSAFLNLLLIPVLGIAGLVASTAISSTICAAVLFVQTHRLARLDLSIVRNRLAPLGILFLFTAAVAGTLSMSLPDDLVHMARVLIALSAIGATWVAGFFGPAVLARAEARPSEANVQA